MDHRRFGRRRPFACDVRDYGAAVACLQEQLRQGRYCEALDIVEQLVAAWPGRALGLLRAAWDIFQSLPDPRSRYYQYQARFVDFGIEPGDRVLDIGSGNIPFPLATHLADIALEDDAYGRGGAAFKRVEGKPVVQCDVEQMPFEDGAFDFVYCSHVLEHVRSPERACRELMRVGKRGYIEAPTPGKDLFFDYAKVSHHRWGVELFDGRLVFTEYSPEQVEGLGCNLLNQVFERPETDREKALAALMLLKADRINTMLLWAGSFEFEVRRLGASGGSIVAPGANETRSQDGPAVVGAGSPAVSVVTEDVAARDGGGTQGVSGRDESETVAAVIPTYNRAGLLARAVRSVQRQSRAVDEIVIVDDGSTDETESVVGRLAAEDGRIRYVRLSHGGAQRARNAGIQAARSAWVAFLDSDDEWLPERVRLGLEAAARTGAPVVHSEGVRYENGRAVVLGRSRLEGRVYGELLAQPGPTFPGLMVRRACFERAGWLDERIVAWQEWDAFLRLARHYPLAYVAEPCFVWHRHATGTISDDKRRDAVGYWQVVEAYKEEILRVLGPGALVEHYAVCLRRFRAAGDAAGYQQVRRAIGAYADPGEVEARSWTSAALDVSSGA